MYENLVNLLVVDFLCLCGIQFLLVEQAARHLVVRPAAAILLVARGHARRAVVRRCHAACIHEAMGVEAEQVFRRAVDIASAWRTHKRDADAGIIAGAHAGLIAATAIVGETRIFANSVLALLVVATRFARMKLTGAAGSTRGKLGVFAILMDTATLAGVLHILAHWWLRACAQDSVGSGGRVTARHAGACHVLISGWRRARGKHGVGPSREVAACHARSCNVVRTRRTIAIVNLGIASQHVVCSMVTHGRHVLSSTRVRARGAFSILAQLGMAALLALGRHVLCIGRSRARLEISVGSRLTVTAAHADAGHILHSHRLRARSEARVGSCHGVRTGYTRACHVLRTRWGAA